jgi:hypothetical protein
MKNRQPLLHSLARKFFILFFILFGTACAQFTEYSNAEREENLQTKIHQFNKRFESKMMSLSAPYLPIDKRRQFLTDSLKIKEKVVFYESDILDAKLFNGDLPVQSRVDSPPAEFDKAIVTMRYQLSVLPSNRLKTITIDQIWRWENNGWFVDPDLDSFFK